MVQESVRPTVFWVIKVDQVSLSSESVKTCTKVLFLNSGSLTFPRTESKLAIIFQHTPVSSGEMGPERLPASKRSPLLRHNPGEMIPGKRVCCLWGRDGDTSMSYRYIDIFKYRTWCDILFYISIYFRFFTPVISYHTLPFSFTTFPFNES